MTVTASFDLDFVNNPTLALATFAAFGGTVTRASTASFVDVAGDLAFAPANTLRVDYDPTTHVSNGILVEETSSNQVRNNSWQGAVAGTPGTDATNWSWGTTQAGLSKQIVGTGTENGIDYIDVRWSGTGNGATLFLNVEDLTNATFNAAPGDIWTMSGYFRLIAGTLPAASVMRLNGTDSGGADLGPSTNDTSLNTVTNIALIRQRLSKTTTMPANTVRARPYLVFPTVNLTAYDFTLRIGLMQVEKRQAMSSVIRTTSAAATRNGDVPAMSSISSFYNATNGTFFAEWKGLPGASGSVNNSRIIGVEGSGQPTPISYNSAPGPNITIGSWDGTTVTTATGTYTTGNVGRAACSFKSGSQSISLNGGAVGTSAGTNNFLTTTKIYLGCANNGADQLNGYIRRLTYFPVLTSAGTLILVAQFGPSYINPVLGDVQQLEPSALIRLFVLDATALGGTVQYFYPDTNLLANNVTWQGNQYTAFPVQIEGLEWTGQGPVPRPRITASNIAGLLTALCLQYDDLVGATVTIKSTLYKYLDAVNYSGGVNPNADPNAGFPDEVYEVTRKISEDRVSVSFELTPSFDVEGVKLPRRYIVQNICMWVYRSAECSYAGGPVADINDTPTSDPNKDACGKRVPSCKLRFGANNQLPYGGFPSVSVVKFS